jgi:urease accessory protein
MEARLASNKLSTRLLKIFANENIGTIAGKYKLSIQAKHAVGHYCIAWALVASVMDITKEKTLTGFYYHSASGFITNAVKLIPLGQHDGQEILISLFPLINELVEKSLTPDQEMIGACCAGFDIRCMQHEQLHSRLYMS